MFKKIRPDCTRIVTRGITLSASGHHHLAAPHPGPLPIGWGEGETQVTSAVAAVLPLPIRMCLARSNVAKRMECVQLAAAFGTVLKFPSGLDWRKRQQAARTPYASRHSNALNTYPTAARTIVAQAASPASSAESRRVDRRTKGRVAHALGGEE